MNETEQAVQSESVPSARTGRRFHASSAWRKTNPAANAVQIDPDQTQLAALDLYRRGLNVFPLVRGSKNQHFGAWGRLQTTRLIDPDAADERERAGNLEIFLRLFENANIAVMCGPTSKNLTVLDCESEAAARYHGKEFAKRSLRPWQVRTARGAHFLWLSDCVIANCPDDKDEPRGWEIRGHSCYVLAPPSVHPSGAVYEWIEREGEAPPSIPIASLDWLPIVPAVERHEPSPFGGGPLARVFKRTREFCERGAPEGERNNRLFAAACDMAARGLPLQDAMLYLWHGCEMSGFDSSFTRRQAERTIASAYSRKRRSIAPERPAPAWARAAAWAETHEWKPLAYFIHSRRKTIARRVSAQTARRVFVACCKRSRSDNSAVFRASQREVAEVGGLDHKTARYALDALVGAGYLLERHHNSVGARLFTFSESAQTYPNNKQWYNTIGGTLRVGIAADVYSFRTRTRKGLGENAGRVWDAIVGRPATSKQVADRLRLQVQTVRRALVRLRQHGLARPVGRFKWLGEQADDASLSEIARRCATLGRAAERKAKHADERARFVSLQMLMCKLRRTRREEQRTTREDH